MNPGTAHIVSRTEDKQKRGQKPKNKKVVSVFVDTYPDPPSIPLTPQECRFVGCWLLFWACESSREGPREPENLGYHAKCLVMSLERKFVKPPIHTHPTRWILWKSRGSSKLETSSWTGTGLGPKKPSSKKCQSAHPQGPQAPQTASARHRCSLPRSRGTCRG